MDIGRRLFIGVTVMIVTVITVTGDVLNIYPNYSLLYVLDSHQLSLTCTSQSTDKLEWYIGTTKAINAGFFNSTRTDNVPGVAPTVSETIGKTEASVGDSATYRCQMDTTQHRNITVEVIPYSVTNAEYKEEEDSVTLACSLTLDPSKYNMHWEFMDERLHDNDKYTIVTETLFINNTAPVDRGGYFCVFTFSENSQVIRIPVSFNLAAGTEIVPSIDPDYAPLYAVVGLPLNLTCSSEGTRDVHWYRGKTKVIDANLGFIEHIDSSSEKTIANIITVRATEAVDGEFWCLTGKGGKSVNVEVLTVNTTSDMFIEKQDAATLVCTLMDLDSSIYIMTWEFNSKTLQDSSKYTIVMDNNTLSVVIKNPGTADKGEYFCTYNFTDNMQVARVPVSLTMAEITTGSVTTESVSFAGTVVAVWQLYLLPILLILLHHQAM